MRGVSRQSFTDLREQLPARASSDELFAVTGLLDTEHGLRRALSDPGKPSAEKDAVARALLHGRVSAQTEDVVAAAVSSRWATAGDLSDAIERLAIEAEVRVADSQGSLDELEDELFRFAQVVDGQPELRIALAATDAPPRAKQELLRTLLGGKVTQVSFTLISQMVAHPRGRSLPAALNLCAAIAAEQRQQLTAVVRSVIELSARQRDRLATALAATYGRRVHLNVVIDPSVMGGLSVQIGDELIDGTSASRLSEVRRKLAS
jgi:F-type H+-transporting ATPase subunit delta